MSVAKRLIDLVISTAAVILLLPVGVVIAIAIKLDSRGPVLFRQERVGRGFRRFKILKFRTMQVDAASMGPELTVARDPRITRVGQSLRRAKLDELPQLLNVLFGDMSIVGPRPEVPKYVDLFHEEYSVILTVRPGITDAASYRYQDEGSELAKADDPERHYLDVILPDKLAVARRNIKNASLSHDLIVISKTVLEAVTLQLMPFESVLLRWRRLIVVLLHLVLIVLANYAAFLLRFDGNIPPYEFASMVLFWPWLVAFRAISFAPFRLYEGLWKYTDIWDVRNIVAAVATSSVPFFVIVRFVYWETAYPRSVFLIDALVLVGLMSGVRLIRRLYGEVLIGAAARTVVICGAGEIGAMIARQMHRDYAFRVTAFVDPNPALVGRRIHGVSVRGTLTDLPRIVAESCPDHVVIAIPELGDATGEVIRDLLKDTAVEVVPFHRLQELFGIAPVAGDRSQARLPFPASSKQEAFAAGHTSQPCPKCQGAAYRSRSRNSFHLLRKRLSDKRLYRCGRCGWRGWMLPLETPAVFFVENESTLDSLALDGMTEAGALPKAAFSPQDLP